MQPPVLSTSEVARLFIAARLGAQAIACSLLLTACAMLDIATTPASLSNARQTEARGAQFETISKDHARVLVPSEAGATLAVLQRKQYDNEGAVSLSQRLILMGDSRTTGENAVEITFRPATNLDDIAPLTDAEMTAAMVDKYDNRPMSLSNRIIANGLGPFALAVGQQDGENCLFAWQRLKSNPLGRHGGGKQTIIDMQIRLCRTNRTLDQLTASLARFIVIEDGEGDDIAPRPVAATPAGATSSVARAPDTMMAPHAVPLRQAKVKDPIRPAAKTQLATRPSEAIAPNMTGAQVATLAPAP